MDIGEQLTRDEIYRRIDVINGKLYWVNVDALVSQRKGLHRQLEKMDRDEEINSLPICTYER